MTEYVITDRTTAQKYALQIDNGEFFFEATSNAASAEPIVEDAVNAGTYWKLFIDDGQFAYESTATVQDDEIDLDDATLLVTFRLQVSDGQFNYNQISAAPVVERQLIVVRKAFNPRIITSALSNRYIKSRAIS